MASTYLSRTLGAATNRKKFTLSFWFKRSKIDQQYLWQSFYSSNFGYRFGIYFNSDNTLHFKGVDGGSTHTFFGTNRVFRDTNAWYHLYIGVDSTQATESDRFKIYVNGVQETSFSSSTYPNQNRDFALGVDGSINYLLYIGRYGNSSSNYFDGLISHFHYVDGSVIAHTQFGSTDSTTGDWKINTSPTISSYGTAGFLILTDGMTITDQSPNSNNLTVGAGTLTKTEDCPSNVFATMNPLSSLSTFSQGNNRILFSSGSGYQPSTSTLGMVSGKFYAEVKIQVEHGNYPGIGIAATNSLAASKRDSDWLGEHSDTYGYYLDGVIYNNGSTVTSGQTTFTTGDIVGLALDLDSAQNTLKYYKNGSLVYTLNINTNSNGYMFGSVTQVNTSNAAAEWNFGNGVFGSSQLTGTTYQASGIGIFKYQPPTNYTALSTKGLNL